MKQNKSTKNTGSIISSSVNSSSKSGFKSSFKKHVSFDNHTLFFTLVIAIPILLLLLLSLFPTITGFATHQSTITSNELLVNSVYVSPSYSELNSSYIYDSSSLETSLVIPTNETLLSLELNALLSGTGSVKIYVEDSGTEYIIYQQDLVSSEQARGLITGMASLNFNDDVFSIPERNQNPTGINFSLDDLLDINNSLINNSLFNDSLINDSLGNGLNLSVNGSLINLSSIHTSKQFKKLFDVDRNINGQCDNTCSSLSLNNKTVKIELTGDLVLYLESIAYTYEERIQQTIDIPDFYIQENVLSQIDLSSYFENYNSLVFDTPSIPGINLSVFDNNYLNLYSNESGDYPIYVYAMKNDLVLKSNTFIITVLGENDSLLVNETLLNESVLNETILNETLLENVSVEYADFSLEELLDDELNDLLVSGSSVRILLELNEEPDFFTVSSVEAPSEVGSDSKNYFSSRSMIAKAKKKAKKISLDDLQLWDELGGNLIGQLNSENNSLNNSSNSSTDSSDNTFSTQAANIPEQINIVLLDELDNLTSVLNTMSFSSMSSSVVSEIEDELNRDDSKKLFLDLNVSEPVAVDQITDNYLVVDVNLSSLEKLNSLLSIKSIKIDKPMDVLIDDSKQITELDSLLNSGIENVSGEGISVCVLDTGLNPSVIGMVDGQNVFGYNFLNDSFDYDDNNGHGTSVINILHSFAPSSTIYAGKVLDSNGVGYSSDILAGLDWCESNNVSVISLSLGEGSYEGYCDDQTVAQKVNELSDAGVLVVAASGNGGSSSTIMNPACARNVLSVGASTKQDEIASFSNINGKTILLAPGSGIETLDGSGNSVVLSGTSLSTPMVAAAGAISISSRDEMLPTLLSDELLWNIIHTGDVLSFNSVEEINGTNVTVEKNYSRLNIKNLVEENFTNNLVYGPMGNESNSTGVFTGQTTYITTCIELQDDVLSGALSSFYLSNDIDCSDTVNWDSGAGFKPIGNSSSKFKGVFNGKGYRISGLYINRPSTDYVGLFGYASASAKSYIGYFFLEDANITGRNYVGSVLGYSDGVTHAYYIDVIGKVSGTQYVGGLFGRITASGVLIHDDRVYVDVTCSSSYCGGFGGKFEQGKIYDSSSYGDVTSSQGWTGGFVGQVHTGGSIKTSFSVGDVQGGNNYVGGFAGLSYDANNIISDCYSRGDVNSTDYVGGFVGYNSNGVINKSYSSGEVSSSVGSNTYCFRGKDGGTTNDNYFDEDVCAVSPGTGATAKTTSQMKTQSTFTNWDFSNLWTMIGYPKFHGIQDCYDLQVMQADVVDTYILENDIDCSDTENWNGGLGFSPIGNSVDNKFEGIFNGHQYWVKGLYQKAIVSTAYKTGLFGVTFDDSAITNFSLVDYNISSFSSSANYATAPISSSFRGDLSYVSAVDGSIIGDSYSRYAGGLVGYFSFGSIKKSFSTGYLKSDMGSSWGAGGFLGSQFTSGLLVNDSFTLTSVTGHDNGGGFGGRLYVNVTNCYSTGNVTLNGASNVVHGFLGYRYAGNYSNNYFDADTSGKSDDYYASHRSTSQMQTQSTFSTWDFTNTWFIDGYYPMLYGFMSLDSNSFSSTSGADLSSDNLTLTTGGASRNGLINVTDWRLNGSSIAVLNMPLERVLSIYDKTRVRDYSTNVNDGILGAGTDAYEPNYVDDCAVGTCLDFDGMNDFVRISSSSELEFGTSDFSISAWIKPDYGSYYGRIINNRGTGSAGSNNGWQFKIQASSSTWKFSDSSIDDSSGNYAAYTGSSTYSTDAWHYVVMVVNKGSNLSFYVDGSYDGSVSASSVADISTTLPVAIGAAISASGTEGTHSQWFNGEMDQLKIFNRSLSPEQIASIYSDESSGHDIEKIVSQETNYADDWSVHVTPNNGYFDGDFWQSENITINSPPEMYSSYIVDSPTAWDNESIKFYCNGTDVDGDNLGYSWYLYNNSVLYNSGNTFSIYSSGSPALVSTVTSSYLNVGDNWTLECRVTDGYEYSSFMNSSNTTINDSNFAPVVSNVILNSTWGTNLTGENLSVYYSSVDDNGDSLTNITDWRVEGTSLAVLNMPFDTERSSVTSDLIRDYSTYENNGTLGGGTSSYSPVWTSSGKVGGAYDFDGTDDLIETFSPDLGSPFTMSAWIKPSDDLGIILGRLNSDWSVSSNGDFVLYSYDSSHASYPSAIRLYGTQGGSSSELVKSGADITFNAWNYIVVTWDGLDWTVYVDGVNSTSGIYQNAGSFSGSSNELFIGGRELDTSYRFDGVIDEVQILNRSLSAEQIAFSYQEGLAGRHVESFVSQETYIGDNWTSCVTPNDGALDGNTLCSNNLKVLNAYAGCVNLSDSSTFQGKLTGSLTTGFSVTDSITLCTDTYSCSVPGSYDPCLSVDSNNINISGNGSAIFNLDADDLGIQIDSHSGIVVDDLIFSDFYSGVDIRLNSVGNTIKNVVVYNSSSLGIYCSSNCSNNNFYNNSLYNNGGISFSISSFTSHDNLVENTFFKDCHTHSIYISEASNNTIINTVVNDSTGAALVLGSSSDNLVINLSGNRLTNDWVLRLEGSSENNQIYNLESLDSAHGLSLDSTDSSIKNYLHYNNSFGKISFTDSDFLSYLRVDNSNISIGSEIVLSQNYAFLDPSRFDPFGSSTASANITLKNTPGSGISNPVILRDGVFCNTCINFTPLDSQEVKFSVTGWSNYTIGSNIAPVVSNVILNSTFGTNLTSENLSVYYTSTDANNDALTNITDWRLEGTSLAVLNMPFDTERSAVTSDLIRDYSTYENNGTLGGGDSSHMPTWVSNCQVGGCYYYNNTELDYIQQPAISSLTTGEPFTISSWVKPESTGTYRTIAGFGYSNRLLITSAHQMRFQQPDMYSASNSVLDDVWTNVVYWFDGSEERWYINGVLSGTPISTNSVDWNSAFKIGRYDTSTNYPMKGYIDEFQIFDRALSAEQINFSYQEGLAGRHVESFVYQETNTGDNWTSCVTPNDGALDGNTLCSNNVEILSDAPSMTSVTVDPDPAWSDDDLEGYCVASSSLGDITAFNWVWYLNGNAYSSGTTSGQWSSGTSVNVNTISSSLVDPGNHWILSCNAIVLVDNSSWLNSSTLVISNYAPSSGYANVSPEPQAWEYDDLLGYCNYTDPDDDLLHYYVNWYVDGVLNRSIYVPPEINIIQDNNLGDDQGNDLAFDSYNNLYLSGSTDGDWWIRKFDNNFTEFTSSEGWNKTIDFFGNSDTHVFLAIDSEDNVYVSGIIDDGSTEDWHIKKFDRFGNEDTINWNKTFDGNGEGDVPLEIIVDSSDNVWVVGYGNNLVDASSQEDWWIKKFNSSGYEDTTNWNKKLDANGGDDRAQTINIDTSGNIYVGGSASSIITGSNTLGVWWLKKFSSTGTEIISGWNKTFNNTQTVLSLDFDSSDNVYASGIAYNSYSATSGNDWLIKKFTSSGTEFTTSQGWNKSISASSTASIDYAFGSYFDSDDIYYVAGMGQGVASASSLDFWVKSFNTSGTELLNYSEDGAGGSDYYYSVVGDNFGKVYSFGYGSNIVSGSSGNDWYLSNMTSGWPSGVEVLVDVIPNSTTSPGENWTIECLANDGTANATYASNHSTLIYSPPLVDTVWIVDNPTAWDNETIEGYCNATDVDGDNVSYYWQWFVNGVVNLTGHTSSNYSSGLTVNPSNLTSSNLTAGDNWTFSCLANDGYYNSTSWTNSTNTTIVQSNVAPVVSNVILNSTFDTNLTSENLSVYYTSTDANNNALTNITDWRVEGTSLAVLNIPFDTERSSVTSDLIRDYSTYENNGTLGDGISSYVPTWTSSGKVGGAYDFDGTDDYIDTKNFLSLENGTTFEAWIYPEDISSLQYVLSNHNGNATSTSDRDGVALRIDDGGIVGFGIAESTYFLGRTTDSAAISLSTWHHIVGVWNGVVDLDGLDIYVDGVLADTTDLVYGSVTHFDNSLNTLKIGALQGASSIVKEFDGKIDQVKIYDHALSAEQINFSYQEGLAGRHVESFMNQETSTGDNWTSCVTPNDAVVDGNTLCSNNVEILSDSPTVTSVVINPDPAWSDNDLIGNCTATSSVGDISYFNYTWYLNGAQFSSGQVSGPWSSGISVNVANISTSLTDPGNIWLLSCSALVTVDYSSWINSSSLTIQNYAPSSGYANVSPEPQAWEYDDLLGYCNYTDPDDDLLHYYVNWYVDGVLNRSIYVPPEINILQNNDDQSDIGKAFGFDSLNRLYLVGTTDYDVWFRKFDNNFTEYTSAQGWNKTFTVFGNKDIVTDLVIDDSDNIYLIGQSGDTNSIYHFWVKKFFSNGTEYTSAQGWNKTFGNGVDHYYGESLSIDSSGNIYAIGVATNLVSGSSNKDWLIKKFSSDGTEYTSSQGWNKTFDSGGIDSSYSVVLDSSDNVYVSGYGYNLINSTSDYDWLIKKFSSDGTEDTVNWNKSFDGADKEDKSYSVVVDSSDNVYVSGRGYNLVNSTSDDDWWIKKFSSGGIEDIVNWNKYYTGSTIYGSDQIFDSYYDSFNDLIYFSGYGYAISSGATKDFWTKSFNTSGSEILNISSDGSGADDYFEFVGSDNFGMIYSFGWGKNLVSGLSNNDWYLSNMTSGWPSGVEVLVDVIPNSTTSPGENWTIECLANDGTDNATYASNYSTLIYGPPVVDTVWIVDSPTAWDNESIAGYCNATDSDGDNISYYWQWFVNGVVNLTGSTLPSNYSSGLTVNPSNLTSSNLTGGDNWTFSCLAYDGYYNSTSWVNSTNTTINQSNQEPVTVSAVIDPSPDIYTYQTLTGYCNGTDVDGDDLYYNYTWYRNGVEFSSGQTSSATANGTQVSIGTISSSNTVVGDNWTLECLAYDGTAYASSSENSSNTTVVDSSNCDPQNPISFSGSGTTIDPYQIIDCCQLQAMNTSLTSSFKLMNDIDCSGTHTWNWNGSIYNGYIPLSQSTPYFEGSLYGENKIISDLFINSSSNQYTGLFGRTSGSSVVLRDIYFENASVYGVGTIGILAGMISSNELIDNIHISSSLVSGTTSVGGAVGLLYSNLQNSFLTSVDVIGHGYNVGGVVGQILSSTAQLINVSADSTDVLLTGNYQKLGGLIGYVGSGSAFVFHNVSFSGSVNNSNYYYTGGLIGQTLRPIDDSFTLDADIYGYAAVGGLIGRLNSHIANISVSNINVSSTSYSGGLVGYSDTGSSIINCSIENSTLFGSPAAGIIGQAHANISNVHVKNVNFTKSAAGLVYMLFSDSNLEHSYLNISSFDAVSFYGTVQTLYGSMNNVSVIVRDNITVTSAAAGYVGSVFSGSTIKNYHSSPLRIHKIPGTVNGDVAGFAYSVSENLSDIVVRDINITGGQQWYGVAAGFTARLNSGVLFNCSVINLSTNTGLSSSGFVGYNYGTINRSGVYNSSIISGYQYSGLFVGNSLGSSLITESVVHNSTLNTSNRYSGGFAGGITSVDALITDSYVDADSKILLYTNQDGGFSGNSHSGNISNSYSATVNPEYGFAGNGYPSTDVIFTSDFWDVNTSGVSSSYGGIGKSTAWMKHHDTFYDASWDIDCSSGTSIWVINDSYARPCLRWEDGCAATCNWLDSPDPNLVYVDPEPTGAPTQDLVGYCNVSDTDSSSVFYNWIWYVNGVEYSTGSTSPTTYPVGTVQDVTTLDSSNTANGQTWIFSCAGGDGLVNGSYMNSTGTLVNNNAPVPGYANVTPEDIALDEEDLFGYCNYTDPDGDDLYYYYTWFVDGVENESGFVPQTWDFPFDGNSGRDRIYDVVTDQFNNMYVVGDGYNIYSGSSYADSWIKKFNYLSSEDITNWNKTYDAFKTSEVAVDTNNYSVYVAGNQNPEQYWYVKKFDYNGTEYTSAQGWDKQIDTLGPKAELHDLEVDSNGDVYLSGTVYEGGSAVWAVKKFSSNGTEYTSAQGWNKTLGNSPNSESAYALALDSNDNLFVGGYSSNIVSGSSSSDGLIFKYTSSGVELWNNSFDNTYESIKSIVIDSSDDVFIGLVSSNLINSTSGNDWWIKKLSGSTGVEIISGWNKSFSNVENHDYITKLSIDSNDNLFVGGYSYDLVSGASLNDWWLKKFNSSGGEDVTEWNKTFNGLRNGHDYGYSLTINVNDEVYFAGTMQNEVGVSTDYDWMLTNTTQGFPSGVEVLVSSVMHQHTTPGENWTLECMAYDGIVNATVASNDSTIIVGSSDATAWIVDSPTAWDNETLEGWCNSTIVNGGYAPTLNVTYNWTWYLNGNQNYSGQTSSNYSEGTAVNVYNLTSSNLTAGDNWTFSCAANNYYYNGSFSNSTNTTINQSNVAPSVILFNPTSNWFVDKTTFFECNYTDDNNGLENVTLYNNYSGTWQSIQTDSISGSSGQSIFEINGFANENVSFVWNCEVCDDSGLCSFASSNNSVVTDNTDITLNFTDPTPSDNHRFLSTVNSFEINLSSYDEYPFNHSVSLDFNNSLVTNLDFETVTGSTLAESTGGNYNGTLTNGAYQTEGWFGSGVSLDGIDNYILTKAMRGSNKTVEFRFKLDSRNTSAYTDLFHMGTLTGYTEYLTVAPSGVLRLNINGNGAVSGSTIIQNETWHHVAYVVNSTNYSSVYLDGNFEMGVQLTGTLTNVLSASYLGYIDQSGFAPLDGYIDEFRSYSRALDWSEINSSVNANVSQYYKNFSGLSQGDYDIKGYAIDVAGNSESIVLQRNITINSLPVVSNLVLNSTYGLNQTAAELIINYDASDADHDSLTNITDWRVGTWTTQYSVAPINSPFDINLSLHGSNNVRSFSTQSMNGTLGGGNDSKKPVWNASGKIGGSYMFNGTGGTSTTPGACIVYGDLDIVQNVSLALWYKPHSSITGAIVEKYSAGPYGPYELYRSGSSLNFRIRNDTATSATTLSASSVLTLDQWNFVVATYDGEYQKIYVNGQEVASVANTGVLYSNTFPVTLGSTVSSSGECHNYYDNSQIDAFQIFNRSLKSDQIELMYNYGLDGRYVENMTWQETAIDDVWKTCITPSDSYEYGVTACSNRLQIKHTIFYITYNDTFVNYTDAHSFNVTAGIYHGMMGTAINNTWINYTNGSCTYLSNVTNMNYFNVTYNCTGTPWVSNDNVTITFTDEYGNVLTTALGNNTYPNVAPSVPVLLTPTDGNLTVHDIRPLFNWSNSTDPESDSINYSLNISSDIVCPAVATDIIKNNLTDSNYTPTADFCPNALEYYFWKVKACDSWNCSDWTTVWNFTLEPYVDIVFINASTGSTSNTTMDFGNVNTGMTYNTTNLSSIDPFRIRNNGNTVADLVNMSSTSSLWLSSGCGLGTSYMQFRIWNATSELNSFNFTGSTYNWTNLSSSNNHVIDSLNYSDSSDEALLEFMIEVPNSEPSGSKSSTITLYWEETP